MTAKSMPRQAEGPPTDGYSVAQDQLAAFVGRIEGLEATIRDLNGDKSEVYKEAKGDGFDIKVLRKVIADRRKDYAKRMEFETIYELYMEALGGVAHAHVEAIEEFDAETGEITEDVIAPSLNVHGDNFGPKDNLVITSLTGTEGDTGRSQIQPHSSAPASEQAGDFIPGGAVGITVEVAFAPDRDLDYQVDVEVAPPIAVGSTHAQTEDAAPLGDASAAQIHSAPVHGWINRGEAA